MRLLGVLFGTVLVNQGFWCSLRNLESSGAAVVAGLERLIVVTPFLLLFGLGVSSVFGLEHPNFDDQAVKGSSC